MRKRNQILQVLKYMIFLFACGLALGVSSIIVIAILQLFIF